MALLFPTVALITKQLHEDVASSLYALIDYLSAKGCQLLVEHRIAQDLNSDKIEAAELIEIGERADLAIVVGGDGNMLGAARVLSRFDISVVGINRGKLGFLTDITPDQLESQLDCLFNGEGIIEQRFLLEAEVMRHGQIKSNNAAVNEVVLHHGKVAHMMEFEVYIDNVFAFSQRSDGLIVSTPTGSTAYSLSGGGPILTPNLDALSLVPMFPHSLSSRPLVVDGNSLVTLKVSPDNNDNLQVSCDSHVALTVLPGDEILIKKSAGVLTLLHPPGHNYFNVLRKKLNWGSRLY